MSTRPHTPTGSAHWCTRAAHRAGWPADVMTAAYQVVGAAVINDTSRTFRSLDRRIKHALYVWGDKYGPLNSKQEEYAAAVLVAAIKFTAALTASGRLPAAARNITAVINEDRVDRGFKNRADAPAPLDLDDLDGLARRIERFE